MVLSSPFLFLSRFLSFTEVEVAVEAVTVEVAAGRWAEADGTWEVVAAGWEEADLEVAALEEAVTVVAALEVVVVSEVVATVAEVVTKFGKSKRLAEVAAVTADGQVEAAEAAAG